MCEILFRGFHPCEYGDKTVYVDGKAVKGRWVEGIPINKNRYIIVSCFDIKELTDEDCMCLKGIIHKVLPSTVGQYTGLTDNKGVKIFEGDIVREHRLCDFQTVFIDYEVDFERQMFVARNKKSGSVVSFCTITVQAELEIIGNTHEEGRDERLD